MTGNVQAKGEGDGEPLIVNHIYDSAIVPPPILAADFNFLYLYEFLVNRVFFGGLPHEDPNLHIKNFLLVCALHRQKNVSDDAFRLRLFPFSLKGKARTWLDDLPARSIHNWDELLEAFLDEFFPRGVIVELRCCVSIFKQKPHERPYVPARQPISTYHNQGQQFSLSEDNYEQAKEATDFSFHAFLNFDGASKGNPGLAGAGAVLRAVDGSVVYRLREGLGFATNNVAEYRGVILGLKYALEEGFKHIQVQGTQNLSACRFRESGKTTNQNMVELSKTVEELKDQFMSFHIIHVERELNMEADMLANLAVLLNRMLALQMVKLK